MTGHLNTRLSKTGQSKAVFWYFLDLKYSKINKARNIQNIAPTLMKNYFWWSLWAVIIKLKTSLSLLCQKICQWCNEMLRHSLVGEVIFFSLQHIVAVSLNLVLCLCVCLVLLLPACPPDVGGSAWKLYYYFRMEIFNFLIEIWLKIGPYCIRGPN